MARTSSSRSTSGSPGSPARPASSSNTLWAKMIHETSNSRGPTWPSPSPVPPRAGNPGTARCRSASRPTPAPILDAATSSGKLASSHASARSTSGERSMSAAANPIPVLEPPEVPAQRGVTGWVCLGQEAKYFVRVGDRVQFGDAPRRWRPAAAPLLRRGRRQTSYRRRCTASHRAEPGRPRNPSERTARRAPRRCSPASAPAAPAHR